MQARFCSSRFLLVPKLEDMYKSSKRNFGIWGKQSMNLAIPTAGPLESLYEHAPGGPGLSKTPHR